MATFEEQVEGITGLTIGSSPAPTSNVFTDMLREGVRDVVNKIIETKPQELSKFTATTASDSGTSVAKIGKILSVVREHNSVTILRQCSPISPGDRYDATDSDSLRFRSKINPGYYELDGSIHTVPAAAQSGDNELHVTQVKYDTGLIGDDTYGGGNIDNFPTDYEHLVVLYASIQSLQSAIANTILSISTSIPTPPVLSDVSISFTQVAPSYIPQSTGSISTYIDTNQDTELAGAKLQEINANMQNSLNLFNQQNAEYQAQLQIAIENARQDGNEDSQKLQKYQGEVASYQAEIQKEVQESTTKTQQYQGLYMQLLQQYNTAFQVAQPQQGGR